MPWGAILAAIAPAVIKGIGSIFGPKPPKFDYNYQLPQLDWDKYYNETMAGPRREASRYSQAATATLPGGVRQGAQEQVGRNLMDVANRNAMAIGRERWGIEAPWAMEQQRARRRDKYYGYGQNKMDWDSIMEALGQGMGGLLPQQEDEYTGWLKQYLQGLGAGHMQYGPAF